MTHISSQQCGPAKADAEAGCKPGADAQMHAHVSSLGSLKSADSAEQKSKFPNFFYSCLRNDLRSPAFWKKPEISSNLRRFGQ
jgi:hypothetical protein